MIGLCRVLFKNLRCLLDEGASSYRHTPDRGCWNMPLAACLLLFVAGITRYWITYDQAATVPTGPESWNLAKSLWMTGHYSDPFHTLPTGPSAHLAPAFPTFLALILVIFGPGSLGAFAYQFATVLVGALLVSLLPVASRVLGMGFLTGVLGACLWLRAKLPLYSSWEATYACLLTMLATCCFRLLIQSTTVSLRLCIPLGLLIGLLLLTSPACLPLIAACIIWLAITLKASLLRWPAITVVLLPLMLITPWTFRNYKVFHRVILVRDNLGEVLATSNNPCAGFSITETRLVRGCYQTVHPNDSLAEARRVRAMGEPSYYDTRMRAAIEWITANPEKFTELCRQRLVAFWLPHDLDNFRREVLLPARRAERYTIYLTTLLSIAGLWLLVRRDIGSGATCAAWLSLFPLIYYLVEFEDRYRQPIMWITFLLGSFPVSITLQWVWRRLERSHQFCADPKTTHP